MTALTLQLRGDASHAQKAFSGVQKRAQKLNQELARTGEGAVVVADGFAKIGLSDAVLGRVEGSAAKLGRSMSDVTKEFDVLGAALSRVETSARSGRGLEELGKQLETLGDEIIEFGGSADDVQSALRAVGDEAGRTGQPVALVRNAMRKLVDESEGAAQSQRYLASAMELSRRAMMKTEDAGALMGRAIKGDTAALRELGGANIAIADQLDKVTDKALKQKLVLEATERAIHGTAGATSRLGKTMASASNQIAATNARLAELGVPGLTVQNLFSGIAVAATGLAVALHSKLNDAMAVYIKRSREALQVMKHSKTATDDLSASVGELSYKFLGGSQSIREWTARKAALNDVLKDYNGKSEMAISKVLKFQGALLKATPPVLAFKGSIAGISYVMDGLLGTSQRVAAQMSADFRKAAAEVRGAWNSVVTGGQNVVDGIKGAWVKALDGFDKKAQAKRDIEMGADKDFMNALRGKLPGRRRRGGGGGGRAKKSKADLAREELIKITDPAKDASKYGEDHLSMGEVMDKARALRDERRQKTQAEFAALNKDLTRLQEIGRETVRILDEEALAAVATRTGNSINAFLQSTTQSTYQLIDALAMGSLTLKDFGAASAIAGGDLVANLGMDIVSKAVGTFAMQLGTVFSGIGAGFEALASNPLALLGIGAGLVAAGLMLKKFGSSSMSSGATTSGARSADSSAANAVQALGRNLFAEQDREERTYNLIIGDYQGFRAMVRDTASTQGAGAPHERGLA